MLYGKRIFYKKFTGADSVNAMELIEIELQSMLIFRRRNKFCQFLLLSKMVVIKQL